VTSLSVTVVGLTAGELFSQEDKQPEVDLSEFRAMAKDYVITSEDSEQPLTLHPQSILHWGNPIRTQERGGVFVWTRDGRPQVVGSMFTYLYDNRPHLKHEMQSVADGPLEAKYKDMLAWTPKRPGVVWQPLAEVATPGKNERTRLVQMRQVARQFQLTLESPQGEKTELRLLAQPIFRYASKSAGVVDGAVFSYAVATEPEALLFVEAAGPPGRETFRYAFARFHYWKLTAVDRAGKLAWSVEADTSHTYNPIGTAANLEKTYNSYQPDPNYGR
jgi:hypothetical protein